jgi:DNA primase
MAGFTEDDIRRVRQANDLVEIVGETVQLRQRGREFWGCCPFHQEKTPSFKVDPSTQLWHCFGCGEGGDLFDYVMKRDDLSFPEAVRDLAHRANIEITEDPRARAMRGKKARLKEVCEETASFYHLMLMRSKDPGAASARSYLSGRNLGGSVPNTWNLGYAPGHNTLVRHLASKGFKPDEMEEANVALRAKNGRGLRDRFYERVMFPIRNPDGETIAFGGRVIGTGEPKYLNTQETPLFHKSEVLFGLDMAKAAMTATGTAIIVEGYTDVIALHEAGVKNAVATLGTALTIQHVRTLSRHAKQRIVYLFDGDEAGQRAADRAARFIDESMLPEAGRSRIGLYAVTLPDNKDPAEYIADHTADDLNGLIANAKPLLRYAIDRRFDKHDLTDFDDKSRVLPEVIELLAPIKHSLLAQEYVGYIADRLQVDKDVVSSALERAKVPAAYQPNTQPGTPPSRQEGPGRSDDTSDRRPGQAPPQMHRRLSAKERNRLRTEREFLSLCARNPQVALAYAETLAQTRWHSSKHEKVCDALTGVLEQHPGASPAEIVRSLDEAVPGAASMITSASQYQDVETDRLATFLSEELRIGDMEQQVAELESLVKDPSSMDATDYEMTYQSAVAMQRELTELRRSHIQLMGDL